MTRARIDQFKRWGAGAFIVLLFGVVGVVVAQDEEKMAAETPAASAIAVDPVVAVVVTPAPDARLTSTEVKELAASAVVDAKSIASGQATMAEVQRDPAQSLDFGSDSRIVLVGWLFGAIVFPLVTNGLKSRNIINSSNAALWNQGIGIAFYLLAWALLHTRYTDLPQEPIPWIVLGALSAGSGSAIRSGYVNARDKR